MYMEPVTTAPVETKSAQMFSGGNTAPREPAFKEVKTENTGDSPYVIDLDKERAGDAPNRAKKYSSWVFTFFPFNDEGKYKNEEQKEPFWDPDRMIRLRYQLEKTPTTGRLHYQGYVVMKNRCKTKYVQDSLKIGKSHVGVMRGNFEQNEDYCTKSLTRVVGTEPKEFGKIPHQGRRTDLELVVQQMKKGEYNELVLAESQPWLWLVHGRRLEELKKKLTPTKVRDWRTRARVLAGPGGTGKTYSALAQYPGAFIKTSKMGHWWTGYESQEVVILDDYKYGGTGWGDENDFNQLINSTPIQVPVHYGSVNFLAKLVIITTNDDVATWPDTMKRRIEEVVPMVNRYNPEQDNIDNVDRIAAIIRPFLEGKTETENPVARVEGYIA